MKKIVLDGVSLIVPGAASSDASKRSTALPDEPLELAKTRLALALGIARQQFQEGGEPAKIVERLTGELHKVRRGFHPAIWQSLIPIVQSHPVTQFLLEDPLTRWSFDKPRGYSGDAHLLDFIYGHPSVDGEIAKSSPLGRAIFEYTRNVSSSVAVRERRDLLTRLVDENSSERRRDTEILAIAAGHLREADQSQALREGRIKRWIALDQDPLSVGTITRDWSGTPVEAIDGSVRGLLSRSYSLGQFDLIYAAGLYDYLPCKVAIALTKACLEMLKLGGQFMFGNFSKYTTVYGYMESFMNWELVLRDEFDMREIINRSVDRNQFDAEVRFGQNRNIIYGYISRRS